MKIPLIAIDEGVRIRVDYGDDELDKLMHSLETIGQLQPILVSPVCDPESSFTYKLIAGGRRFRAHQLLVEEGKERFSEINCLVRDDVPAEAHRIAEMEENLQRKDMDWKEYALGVLMYHEERSKEYSKALKKFTDTICGNMLGIHYTYVGKILPVAKALKANDPEVQNAATMLDAINILLRRRQAAMEAKLVKDRPPVEVKKAPTPAQEKTSPTKDDTPTVLLHPVHFSVVDIRTEHFPSLLKCDHVFTDIPYGIEMSNLNVEQEVADAHGVNENIELLEDFWSMCDAMVSPFGWVGTFFDMIHFEKLCTLATSHGFIPMRWPIICDKGPNSNANNAPRQNATKTYESFLLARRPKATLARHVGTSILPWTWAKGERDLYTHNFSKPQELATTLLSMFAKPGETIYDPFCGEGSLVQAAQNFGCRAYGSDYETIHINRAHLRITNSVLV